MTGSGLFRERLLSRLTAAGVPAGHASVQLSNHQFSQLEQYYEQLRRWNRRINLTSLSLEGLPDATVDRLFVEPLCAATLLGQDSLRWADLGSGGGSPAIPLKVARPSTVLTMVESRVRKCAFLRSAAMEVGLTDSSVLSLRAEEMPPAATAAFDIVTVRAVRLDASFLKAISRVLAPAGRMVLFSPMTAVFEFDDFEPIQEVLISSTSSRISEFRRGSDPELDV